MNRFYQTKCPRHSVTGQKCPKHNEVIEHEVFYEYEDSYDMKCSICGLRWCLWKKERKSEFISK